MSNGNFIQAEQTRMKAEYARRESEIDSSVYSPWQAAEILMTSERKRKAALLLKEIEKFPDAGARVLEIGYGRLGWLADMLSWGVHERDLYGIELDKTRAQSAQQKLPVAQLEVGDATDLPWEEGYFHYVVVSTVFSSVLDENVRSLIAKEISRVLRLGGVTLYYDLAINNPQNPSLRRVSVGEISALFPNFACSLRSLTLAPPIARAVANRSWILATMLSGLPFLRTHLLGALIKKW